MPGLFFAAMAPRFVVNDSGLSTTRSSTTARTRDRSRGGGAGLVVGITTEIPEAAVAVAIGLLAGGILNVLK